MSDGVDRVWAEKRAREVANKAIVHGFKPEARQSEMARQVWERIYRREFNALVSPTSAA